MCLDVFKGTKPGLEKVDHRTCNQGVSGSSHTTSGTFSAWSIIKHNALIVVQLSVTAGSKSVWESSHRYELKRLVTAQLVKQLDWISIEIWRKIDESKKQTKNKQACICYERASVSRQKRSVYLVFTLFKSILTT